MLTLGGLMLFVFFLHLGEMPEVNLASSTSLLAAVALIGATVMLFFGGTTIAIGLVYRGVGDRNHPVRNIYAVLCSAVPLAAIAVLAAIEEAWQLNPLLPGTELKAVFGLGVAISIALTAVSGWVRRSELKGLSAWKSACHQVGRFTLFSAFVFLWTIVGMAMTFGSLIALSGSSDSAGSVAVNLMAWTAVCIATNATFSVAPKNKEFVLALLFIGTGFVFLTLLTRNPVAVPMAAVRALGLGDFQARLVVTADGCDILNKAERQKVCLVPDGEKTAVVCPVTVRSAIGSPVIVQFTPWSNRFEWPGKTARGHIPIPRDEVLSWPHINRLIQKRPSSTQPSAPSTAASSAPKEDLNGSGKFDPQELRRQAVSHLDRAGLDPDREAWLSTQCDEFSGK